MAAVNNRQASAGTPTRAKVDQGIPGQSVQRHAGLRSRAWLPRRNWAAFEGATFRPGRSSLGEGRRGVQEHNCSSKLFISFIILFPQAAAELFHPVTVPARRCVRRYVEQITDFLKRACLPDLQDNDLALRHGQFRQTPHCCAFGGQFLGGPLEPSLRFQFPRQPPPEAPAIVQRAIAKAADAIVRRVLGLAWVLPQRKEGLLHHILGFRVGETERATIKNQLGRFRVVQPFVPGGRRVRVHSSTHRHPGGPICIKSLRNNWEAGCRRLRTQCFQ